MSTSIMRTIGHKRSQNATTRTSALAFLASALAFVAALAPGTSAASTPLEQLRAGPKLKAEIGKAPSGKVMLLVDGRPSAPFWANLTDGSHPDYTRAGFNTVFAEIGYGGELPMDQFLGKWDEVLLTIKKRGLMAVIYIHNTVHASAGKRPWAFDKSWRDYVQTIVKRYRGASNLIGWCFSDEVGDQITYTDEDFRAFLKREYESIARLNDAWGTRHADFGQIKLEYQRKGHGRPAKSMVTPEFPFGVGPKAFDSASFKLRRVARGHKEFEAAVREVDPDTPIWGGANNLGWPATRIPTGWGAFFDFYPQYSGNDFETHHVWAMDIGRGPNVRPAMQMLLPEHSGSHNWHLDSRVFRGWMVESAIHGAAGITVWPWSFLGSDDRPGDRATSIERIDSVGMTIRTLTASGIFEMLPTNTIAVIYEPYAEGWGNMSQVYGLLRYPSGEPVHLMRELKFGTRCGQVDYLTRLHLAQARLDDYGVILAPFVPDLDEKCLEKLSAYVRNGGVLFADIGFDCIRAGKVVSAMTERARQLFGIKGLQVSKAKPGRFVATGECAELLGGLEKDRDATGQLTRMALDVDPTTAVAALRGPGRQGLYVNSIGTGYAIFCSTLAWSAPVANDALLRKIHNALFSRRARIEDAGDAPAPTKPTTFTNDYELARFASGYVVQNRANQRKTLKIRTDGRPHQHDMPPRSVLLIKDGHPIPLGTGVWPVKLGPK